MNDERTMKMKTYMFNRKKYRELKKMDHAQMDVFFQEVYKRGYHDGMAENKMDIGAGREFLLEVLSDIKGVGIKTVQKIMAEFDRRVENGTNTGTERQN